MPASDFHNPDKTFKSPPQIQRLPDHLGVRRDQLIHTCCGGGAATMPFFALKFLLDHPPLAVNVPAPVLRQQTVSIYLDSVERWAEQGRAVQRAKDAPAVPAAPGRTGDPCRRPGRCGDERRAPAPDGLCRCEAVAAVMEGPRGPAPTQGRRNSRTGCSERAASSSCGRWPSAGSRTSVLPLMARR